MTRSQKKVCRIKYAQYLKLCRKDAQAALENIVSPVANQPGVAAQAEKIFVVKLRAMAREKNKLVRKLKLQDMITTAINKSVEPFVNPKIGRRENNWLGGGVGRDFGVGGGGFGGGQGGGNGWDYGAKGGGKGGGKGGYPPGTRMQKNGMLPLKCFVCNGNHYQSECQVWAQQQQVPRQPTLTAPREPPPPGVPAAPRAPGGTAPP